MSRRPHAPERGPAGESGYTLTEVLVALVILSVSIVAVVGAIGSSIFTSREHRSIVTADTAVRAYASQLTQLAQTGGYVNCATTSSYPAMSNPPGAMTVKIVSITYWDGSSGSLNGGQNFGAGCPTLGQGAQKIVIRATSTNSAGKQSLAFVLRAP